MILDFQPQEGMGMIASFAKILGVELEGNALEIPAHLGSGYLKGYLPHPSLRLMIRNYELYEDLLLRRRADNKLRPSIVFSLNHILKQDNGIQPLPSVQIAVGGFDYEQFFPSKNKFTALVISIDIEYLNELLGQTAQPSILNTILQNKQPFLFEEILSIELQDVAQQIASVQMPASLESFYLKTKVEELICLILSELYKREDTNYQALHVADVQKIYEVKAQMLTDLSITPHLSELADRVNMSESKLKRLFKQIFGQSVYQYYQHFRMKEAARLLRESKLSVSEVGYLLGFTNLSHFSRVFEEHIGQKPKRWSKTTQNL